MDANRVRAREIAREYLEKNDPLGWFEQLYASAKRNANIIPWADLAPNPNLVGWLDKHRIGGSGKKAIKVGCGLGDDAEELANRDFEVTAFDISATAINWCTERFPESKVDYLVEDLFSMPVSWNEAFDFVLESYTLQVLPLKLRIKAAEEITRLLAPGGTLLVICRGRDETDEEGKMPWPITRKELKRFEGCGLRRESFEDYKDNENPPVRRFRALYRK
jgi:ubiquinone/menaquinone biosynthesis C-methylase UbiE